jgi:hypothetical protein
MRATSRLALIGLTVAVVLMLAAVAAGAAGAAPGSFIWKKVLDPSTKNDGLYVLAKGPGGSVYACGTTRGINLAGADIWLVKYKSGGGKAWSRTWNGPAHRSDYPGGMAVDAAGNVYIAGATEPSTGGYDTAVLKYDAAGHRKWTRVYSADPSGTNEAKALALDPLGGVCVAGVAYRSGSTDAYVARFRGNGTRAWTCWYDGGGYTGVSDVAVSNLGECYVAGSFAATGQDYDAFLLKTTAAGAPAWVRPWDGGGGNDGWWSVAASRYGGVAVAGSEDYGGTGGDVAVARYSALGVQQWAHTWSSSGNYSDDASDVAISGSLGYIWVAGRTYVGAGSYRGALIKYNDAGLQLTARTMGSGTKGVALYSITLDPAGNPYVAGRVQAAAGGWNPLAMKYLANGKFGWEASLGFPGTTDDGFNEITLGPSGTVYACGGIGNKEGGAINTKALLVKIRR